MYERALHEPIQAKAALQDQEQSSKSKHKKTANKMWRRTSHRLQKIELNIYLNVVSAQLIDMLVLVFNSTYFGSQPTINTHLGYLQI